MSVQVISDNKVIDSKLTIFSDGAVNLWIDPSVQETKSHLAFTINPDTPVSAYGDILALAEHILIPVQSKFTMLNLPYFPNARADREFESGMSNPLTLFCQRIDAKFWDEIHTDDVHNRKAITDSLVGVKLFERIQAQCFRAVVNCNRDLKGLTNSTNTVICAPDKGASEKALTIANYFELPCVQLDKVRNPKTGWIESVSVSNDVSVAGKDVLIVDDICDGGMTFIKSAQALKDLGADSVSLYVTHGIFSKGLTPLRDFVDRVYCKQIIMNYITRQDITNFNNGA